MQTDTGTIRTLDEPRSRRAPRVAVAALAVAAVVAVIAVAAPAAVDDAPPRPVVQPVTVDTTLPAIGLSHVPPNGPLPAQHAHGPRQVPKQGALGG